MLERDIEIPCEQKHNLLRALFHIRTPKPLNHYFLDKIDSLLQFELKEKGIVEVEKLESVATMFPNNPFSKIDKFIVWQRDIT